MAEAFLVEREGDGAVAAVALHDGHELRHEVARLLALDERDRLREEDPFTGSWTAIAGTRAVVRRSRFEVDLNRPRPQAVYLKPEDAWGLQVWKEPPPQAVVERSLAIYDAFYARMAGLFDELTESAGRLVVYDLHSYNHRRGGPAAEPDPPAANPEVNLGTGTLDRGFWGPVVEAFLHALRSYDFQGRRLDVRENVRFRGGHFPRWIHERYPGRVCALAIEVKKFFMDEWTGEPYPEVLAEIPRALEATLDPVREALRAL